MLNAFRFTIGCVFIFVSAGQAWAQQPSSSVGAADSDWTALASLPIGSVLRIDLTSGGRAGGRLVAVSADRIRLSAGGGEAEILRVGIRQVVLRGGRKTARRAKLGFLAGAIAGAVVGAVAAEEGRVGWSLFTAGLWGAIGGGLGAIVGYSHRDESVVYLSSNAAP